MTAITSAMHVNTTAPHWSIALAAALAATLDEAGKHRVTMDRARRRILHRIERGMWRNRSRAYIETPKPNRHARRAASA